MRAADPEVKVRAERGFLRLIDGMHAEVDDLLVRMAYLEADLRTRDQLRRRRRREAPLPRRAAT